MKRQRAEPTKGNNHDALLVIQKIENDVYNFPTWQYCKYKDIFDSRIIINSTAKFYISISYQKDLLSIDTRIFTPSHGVSAFCFVSSLRQPALHVFFFAFTYISRSSLHSTCCKRSFCLLFCKHGCARNI